MKQWAKKTSFLEAFGIRPLSKNERGHDNIVSIIGAGGKTSLMFRLAQEARQLGAKVLVTTSTKMWIPEKSQYDFLDLSGDCSFQGFACTGEAGIYVGGVKGRDERKMIGVRLEHILAQGAQFDLILIEADGAAEKSLKGWNETEPVITPTTSHTIGVVDISTLGVEISTETIHRLDYFRELTYGIEGETVALYHLQRIIQHSKGLFARSVGKELVYLNKMESAQAMENGACLRDQLTDLTVVGGSVRQGMIYG